VESCLRILREWGAIAVKRKFMKIGILLLGLSFISIHQASAVMVRLLANCSTPDGLTIQVFDNRGPVQTPNLGSIVRDSGGNLLAVYKVAGVRHGSVSFGRRGYEDVMSNGNSFSLLGPSTNFRHYSLMAKPNMGSDSSEIRSDDLMCTVFGGGVLPTDERSAGTSK
jgi:hypothetical protein